jgi:uncharacterized sulfatase
MPPRQAIVFLLDTQGANCVGCYRPELALRTPHLDRLAAEGIRFTAAYTCSPVCGPARSALLTGLFPHANGVFANDYAPHADIPTVGQRLARRGCATGYIGKWHLDGTDYFGNGRCPEGWDPSYWFDGRNYLDSLPDAAARALSRRVLGPAEVRAEGVTAEFTHAHRTADRAIRFVEEHRDRDFLLFVSIDEPHHPFICPEPYASAFEGFRFPVPNAADPLTDKPRAQQEWSAHLRSGLAGKLETRDGAATIALPRYLACNSYADAEVGRVLAAVDRLTPQALVVHTSDHGDMFGSHALMGKGPAVYEEIVRIPFIVRWPGHAPAGAVSAGPVSHVDLVPTLLDFMGAPVPRLLQGRSLLPQLQDPAQAVNERVFLEFNRYEVDHDGFGAFAPIRCVHDGRHKLALNLLDRDELYDLADDPGELRNRIDDPACAAVRDTLHAELLAWMDRSRDPLRGPHWRRRPWAKLAPGSTWGGATRPRPEDDEWQPRVLLYETAEPVDRDEYGKW